MTARIATFLILGAALGGCESDGTGPNPPLNVVGTTELDAGSTTQFVYFDLAGGTAVSVADPGTSSAWDLAVRRYEVRLNGGAMGPKGVAGYNLANNASATAQQVLAFTPENQLPAFQAFGESSIPAAGSFVQEGLAASPMGWLTFGATGPAANTRAWKLRRTAGGGHAVFRTSALTLSGSNPQTAELATVTIQWRYQPAGGTLGAAQEATLATGAANPALDLAAGTLGPATGCGWDIQANPDFTLVVNSACNVGTFPLDASQQFDALTQAGDALQYGAFLAGLSGAVPFTTSLDNPLGPFLYNLAGDNRLSPTFNTYLITVGDAVYKVQLIGYYSATGASGHPTLRFARVR